MDNRSLPKLEKEPDGTRVFAGKTANYRVVSAYGPWLVEVRSLYAADDAEPFDEVAFPTLELCRTFIQLVEDNGDTDLALDLTNLKMRTKN